MPSVRNKELVIHLRKNKGENIGIRVQQSKVAPANYEIKKLNENGAAARDSSLREGDLITAVNGKSLKGMNKDAVMLLLKQCADMNRVTFDVVRKDTSAESPAAPKPAGGRRQDSIRKTGPPSPLPPPRNGNDNTDGVSKLPPSALKSPIPDGGAKTKKTRSVSIVVPGQRRSREQLYDHDDIILLDPSKAASADDSTKPISPLQQKPPRCPIELPPDINKDKLNQKSKSLAPSVDRELPYNLPGSEITRRSEGAIVLPSMKKRTKPITLHNYRTKRLFEDRLVNTSIKKNPTGCGEEQCVGSHVNWVPLRGSQPAHDNNDLQACAEDFLEQYYSYSNRARSDEHSARLDEVLQSIEDTGTYELTLEELEFGAKMAWRNAPRCLNRMIWNTLHVFDRRKVNTTQEMFQSLLEHMRFATNNGNLRSTITIFRQRIKPGHDFRVWNELLIRYAGYEREKPDGTREIIGDPASLDFTKACMRLGWRPPDNKFGNFDILPLVLQANGKDPEFFIIPEDLVLEVHLTHPEYDWFEEFDLKWYALPAVSNMLLEIGGLEFTACPFNGWYMSAEIGCRNLCDSYRYNLLKPVAQRMGLDTKQDRSLWKDKALVEVNIAVISSFQKAQVAIVDHHSASETFMKHMENEYRVRGGCPADWVWVVPPISGSCVETFHQEMLHYHLSPSYEYQVPAWKGYKFKDNIVKSSAKGGAIKLKSVVNMIMLTKHLFTDIALKNRFKTLVLYATETGRSKNYAGIVNEIFSHAFDSREMCMEEYDIANLPQEHLVLVVTSTFGSGDPPSNGELFGQALYDLRHPTSLAPRTSHRLSTVLSPRVESAPLGDNTKLSNVKFSVFGLGSRAFPNFCTFAHSIDKLLEELGGERFHPCGEGDELCGQEESFRSWCRSAYQEACKKFGVDPNLKTEDTDKMLASGKAHSYEKGRFRAKPWDKSPVEHDICVALSKVHKKPAHSAVLKSRKNLQSKESNRLTILCVMESDQLYEPGDHLAIYPENDTTMVNTILKRLNPSPGPDEPIVLEYRNDTENGDVDWEQETCLPVPVTLRQALTHYLDITSPPTPQFLSLLAKQTTRPTDREMLTKLAEGGIEYEDWKYSCFPNLLDVIEQFPSLQKMDICLLLTGLPLLQTRYYSISSSPLKHPNEIHITVAVVTFMKKVLTEDGRGLMHHGVCSTWLNTISVGATVPCSIRVARNFHMPDDPKTPMILIGPGTGIAPFRSFWQEREYQMECVKAASTPSQPMDLEDSFSRAARKEMRLAPSGNDDPDQPFYRSVSDAKDLRALARKAAKKKDRDFGKAIIYFGCRHSRMDHIYKEELEKCKMSGALDEVYVAFSRDKEVMEKTYVQDLLKKNADEITELLMESQAHFYVCGDISMASDVYRTLENIMADHAAMSSSEAREFMDKIKESGRYHEDIFGVTLRTAEVTQQKRTAAKRAWTILFSAMDGSTLEVAGGGLQQQQQQQQDDQTDGAAAAAAQQQQNTGVRRLSLVRRPTVTVLINQQAGTPTTPGTPKVAFWPVRRRKPSEPIMDRTGLEIPAHHVLNRLPEDQTQPSSQSDDKKPEDHETPPDS